MLQAICLSCFGGRLQIWYMKIWYGFIIWYVITCHGIVIWYRTFVYQVVKGGWVQGGRGEGTGEP